MKADPVYPCLALNVRRQMYVPQKCNAELHGICHIFPEYGLPTDKITVQVTDLYNLDAPLQHVKPYVWIDGELVREDIAQSNFLGQTLVEAPCSSEVTMDAYCIGSVGYNVDTTDFNTPSEVLISTTKCHSFAAEPASLGAGFEMYHNSGSFANPVMLGDFELSATADLTVRDDRVHPPTGVTRAMGITSGYHDPGLLIVPVISGVTAGQGTKLMVTDLNGRKLAGTNVLFPDEGAIDTYWITGCWNEDSKTFTAVNTFVSTLPVDVTATYCP